MNSRSVLDADAKIALILGRDYNLRKPVSVILTNAKVLNISLTAECDSPHLASHSVNLENQRSKNN